MIQQLIIGSAMIFITTMIYGIFVVTGMRAVRSRYPRTDGTKPNVLETLNISGFVLWMFLASVIEIWTWAGLYVWLGSFASFEEALYFSTATFTTLGYGDVILNTTWRLLGSFEAANGLLLFGWSTALVFTVVQLVYRPPEIRT